MPFMLKTTLLFYIQFFWIVVISQCKFFLVEYLFNFDVVNLENFKHVGFVCMKYNHVKFETILVNQTK
jgi:hypothetical protein